MSPHLNARRWSAVRRALSSSATATAAWYADGPGALSAIT